MKVMYTSPVFKNLDGSFRKVMIAEEGIKTHIKRDTALAKMMELGGIHAKPTAEFMALRRTMISAKRKIEKNGWFATEVK